MNIKEKAFEYSSTLIKSKVEWVQTNHIKYDAFLNGAKYAIENFNHNSCYCDELGETCPYCKNNN